MQKLIDVLDWFIYFLSGVILISASSLLLFSVLYRYAISSLYELSQDSLIIEYVADLLSNVSVTADEVPGYFLVWISFLGAYLAMRDKKHIKFDMLLEHCNHKLKSLIELAVDLLTLAFFFMLFYYSILMIIIDGSTEIETAEIAQGYFMLIFPLSSFLIILATLIDIYQRKPS